MTVDLCDYRLVVDARKPIPPQVCNWLREVSAELLATADTIEGFDDGSDLTPPAKPRGPRKAALVASLALASGCCPPATIKAPAQQSQSTITIQHGQHSQSVQVQQNGGSNVVSRVSVGPGGKMTVEEVEVSPAR